MTAGRANPRQRLGNEIKYLGFLNLVGTELLDSAKKRTTVHHESEADGGHTREIGLATVTRHTTMALQSFSCCPLHATPYHLPTVT